MESRATFLHAVIGEIFHKLRRQVYSSMQLESHRHESRRVARLDATAVARLQLQVYSGL
jgi:hypothetical protein